MPIADLVFYLAAVPAILVVGISKGGFGGGLALVGVPVLSLVIPPAQAAAIMLPILICMDAVGVGAYRRQYDPGALRVMVPGAVAGIAIGGLLFGVLDASAMRLTIGTIALLFVAHRFTGGAAQPAKEPNAWLGGVCGALAGFTSTLAHAGGPPAQMYLLPLKLDKTVFVATSVILFAVINVVKLVPYWLLGEFHGTTLWTAAVLAPLAPVGMGLGIWLHRRVDQALFYKIAYLFVAITGTKLVYDGLFG